MPLVLRFPMLMGFRSPRRIAYGGVNVGDLAKVEDDAVGPEQLRSAGLVKKRDRFVKVLGHGEIDRAVTVRAHAFSAEARRKIEAAGGKAEVIDRRAASRESA